MLLRFSYEINATRSFAIIDCCSVFPDTSGSRRGNCYVWTWILFPGVLQGSRWLPVLSPPILALALSEGRILVLPLIGLALLMPHACSLCILCVNAHEARSPLRRGQGSRLYKKHRSIHRRKRFCGQYHTTSICVLYRLDPVLLALYNHRLLKALDAFP